MPIFSNMQNETSYDIHTYFIRECSQTAASHFFLVNYIIRRTEKTMLYTAMFYVFYWVKGMIYIPIFSNMQNETSYDTHT